MTPQPLTQDAASELGRRLLAALLAGDYSDRPVDYEHAIATRWPAPLADFAATWREAKGHDVLHFTHEGQWYEAHTWAVAQPMRYMARSGFTIIRISDEWVIGWDEPASGLADCVEYEEMD